MLREKNKENRKSTSIESQDVNSETKIDTQQDSQDGFKNLPKWKQDKILRERKLAEEKLKKEQEEKEKTKISQSQDEAAECPNQSDDGTGTQSLIECSNNENLNKMEIDENQITPLQLLKLSQEMT